MTMFKMSLE